MAVRLDCFNTCIVNSREENVFEGKFMPKRRERETTPDVVYEINTFLCFGGIYWSVLLANKAFQI